MFSTEDIPCKTHLNKRNVLMWEVFSCWLHFLISISRTVTHEIICILEKCIFMDYSIYIRKMPNEQLWNDLFRFSSDAQENKRTLRYLDDYDSGWADHYH